MKRSPIRRKSAKKKRRPSKPCTYSSRCVRPARFVLSDEERLCSVHLKWTAKKLVGDAVKARDGRCVLADFTENECQGPLQWAHLIPQGRYPSLRFEKDNAITACLRHHTSFDRSPVERELWMRRWLGPLRYQELQQQAVRAERVDIVEVILRERAEAA